MNDLFQARSDSQAQLLKPLAQFGLVAPLIKPEKPRTSIRKEVTVFVTVSSVI